MKKTIISLILIFLTGCQFINSNKTQRPINAFKVSEACPYVCWLGINPGKTTVKEVEQIINASNQIDHKQTSISDTHMVTIWMGESGTISIVTNIYFDNGIVSGISFTPFPSTVGELIDLFGSPSHISISAIEGYDGMHTPYMFYFQSTKTFVVVPENLHQGPDPSNAIAGLDLNSQFDISNPPPQWVFFQPWLGYGHSKEYLPTLVSP